MTRKDLIAAVSIAVFLIATIATLTLWLFDEPATEPDSAEVLSDEHTGYQGVVVDIDDAHLSRPKIRLLFDDAGERIGAINIDLRERGDVDVKSVRGPEPKMEPLGSSTPSDDDYEDDDEYEDGDDYEEDDIQFIEPEDA